MNFYRHFFNIQDGRDNLLSTLSNLGFYDVDTQRPPTETIIPAGDLYTSAPYPNINLPNLYWNKDNLHKFYFKSFSYYYTGNNTERYYHGFYKINCSDPLFAPNNNHTDTGGWYVIKRRYTDTYSITNTSYDTLTHSLIFIPLKNGGFLLNNLMNGEHDGNSLGQCYSKTTFPLMVIGSKSSDYPTVRQYNTKDGENGISSTTVIGLPPTNKSVLKDYLYIFSSSRWVSSDRGYVAPVLGPNEDPSFLDPSLTPFIDNQTSCLNRNFPMYNNYQKYTHVDQNKPYMNFNPNVCILTKYPYDNGFVDNLYIMATCPNITPTTTGSFFSFGGRSFVNIYGNMVLELPGY